MIILKMNEEYRKVLSNIEELVKKNVTWVYEVVNSQNLIEKYHVAIEFEGRLIAEDDEWLFFVVEDEKVREGIVRAGGFVSEGGIWAVPKFAVFDVIGAGYYEKKELKEERVVRRSSSNGSRRSSRPRLKGVKTVEGLVKLLDGYFAPEEVRSVMDSNDVDAMSAFISRIKEVVDDRYKKSRAVAKVKYVMYVRGLTAR